MLARVNTHIKRLSERHINANEQTLDTLNNSLMHPYFLKLLACLKASCIENRTRRKVGYLRSLRNATDTLNEYSCGG